MDKNFKQNAQVDTRDLSRCVPRLVRWFRFWFPNRKNLARFIFKPQKDITAWELSQLVPYMNSPVDSVLTDFPDSVLRHLEFEGSKLSATRIQQLREVGRISM